MSLSFPTLNNVNQFPQHHLWVLWCFSCQCSFFLLSPGKKFTSVLKILPWDMQPRHDEVIWICVHSSLQISKPLLNPHQYPLVSQQICFSMRHNVLPLPTATEASCLPSLRKKWLHRPNMFALWGSLPNTQNLILPRPEFMSSRCGGDHSPASRQFVDIFPHWGVTNIPSFFLAIFTTKSHALCPFCLWHIPPLFHNGHSPCGFFLFSQSDPPPQHKKFPDSTPRASWNHKLFMVCHDQFNIILLIKCLFALSLFSIPPSLDQLIPTSFYGPWPWWGLSVWAFFSWKNIPASFSEKEIAQLKPIQSGPLFLVYQWMIVNSYTLSQIYYDLERGFQSGSLFRVSAPEFSPSICPAMLLLNSVALLLVGFFFPRDLCNIRSHPPAVHYLPSAAPGPPLHEKLQLPRARVVAEAFLFFVDSF